MVTKKEKAEKVLKLMERGAAMWLTYKFAEVIWEMEDDISLRAWEIFAVGRALGEQLGTVEYPIHWERFLRRKDCPKYLKEIGVSRVNAYYPKLSLPEEEHWVTFELPINKDDRFIS